MQSAAVSHGEEGFIREALRGYPPSIADKNHFSDYVCQRILPSVRGVSVGHGWSLLLNIAALIGRFLSADVRNDL